MTGSFSPVFAAETSVRTPSIVAAPALSSTVARRNSTKRIRALSGQLLERGADAERAVDQQVGRLLELARGLVGADAHAYGLAQPPVSDRGAQRVEGVDVCAVVPGVQRHLD